MQVNNLLAFSRFFRCIKAMGTFAQVTNPITGQNTWQVHGDEYDYHQEVANAGFGDMLHDSERNEKYFSALKKTIAKMHKAGREVHVLDIGTGTGILSMMALQAGANTVTACEAFLPMANCAERIFAVNGVADRVHLIKKRSTDIAIGVDMPRKANLLVTEILDTELIGEGAISIYNHAHEELLTDDALCIPARANCYAQVAQSPLAAQWNTLKILANLDGDVLLQPPTEVLQCSGEATLHDVQLSQLPTNEFRPVTQPVQIFQFDFQRKETRDKKREQVVRVKAIQAGAAELVFYWWNIEMDDDGEILLSCAPYWAHPELKQLGADQTGQRPLANTVPWRDHWMQAIYYIPKPLQLSTAGKEFWLVCNHDEYSLWFDAYIEAPLKPVRRHTCTCDLHMTYSRSRIGQLNQAKRNKAYLRQLEQTITKDSHVLVLGDGCLLGIATAKMEAVSVICHEPHRFSRRLLTSITKKNQLNNVKFIDRLEQLGETELKALTHIVAEPYFLNAILPWDNFYFGTLLLKIQQQLNLSVVITPCVARIFALPVHFLDLHKIRTPVGNCEGFDLTLFDKMVEHSVELAQSKVEAQPLWEYPSRALSQPQEILCVNFKDFSAEQRQEGSFTLPGNSEQCNGVALWVDWQLNANDTSAKSTVSSGPVEPIEIGKFVKWDMFVRQGVHFTRPESRSKHVDWSTEFKPLLGQLNFNFTLRNNIKIE
ncbi:protein arginine N-methyltransferase 7 [Scaptodrosophila lebanonensis]|uniref:Protein arginine N-methyltransferase n=1 Tax=Drosophila lebanonensis TaxID=7225 RepID=A0A6J2TFK0_DROLE|nr:protein arginine N-methyltransferase 7 [Scaptodrosophila lebanonensis]